MNVMAKFREEQQTKMESTCVPLGDVTTVNLTTIQVSFCYICLVLQPNKPL